MDINEFKKFQIFRNLNENEIILFQKKMKNINIPEGQNFIVEGDIGDSIYPVSYTHLTLPTKA